MGPIVALVYSASLGYCLEENCPDPARGAPWANWVPCQVFERETIPSSHWGGASAPLGPISGYLAVGVVMEEVFLLLILRPQCSGIKETRFLLFLFFLCLTIREEL